MVVGNIKLTRRDLDGYNKTNGDAFKLSQNDAYNKHMGYCSAEAHRIFSKIAWDTWGLGCRSRKLIWKIVKEWDIRNGGGLCA